jgi:hypothetical protein
MILYCTKSNVNDNEYSSYCYSLYEGILDVVYYDVYANAYCVVCGAVASTISYIMAHIAKTLAK